MPSSARKSRVDAGHRNVPLIDYLADQWSLSRRQAKRALDARRVFVNARRVWMARHRLEAGDWVELLEADPAGATAQPIPVLHADDQLVIVDKPAGLESVGKDQLEGRLRRQLDDHRLLAVHRLDRDTTGCLTLARNLEVKTRLVDQFEARTVLKQYRALVIGSLKPRLRTIRTPLDGKPALSQLRLIRATPEASYIAVRIETGRTHQIRRHLASLHHPVLGDPQYSTNPVRSDLLRQVPRPMLHAYSIQFRHPHSEAILRAEAALPADFRIWLARLRLG